jgi:hypothetical protein
MMFIRPPPGPDGECRRVNGPSSLLKALRRRSAF